MIRMTNIQYLTEQGIPLIVYDPEQVDIDIKGYKDLWDKSLEDSIAIVGNYRVICGITQLSMGRA